MNKKLLTVLVIAIVIVVLIALYESWMARKQEAIKVEDTSPTTQTPLPAGQMETGDMPAY